VTLFSSGYATAKQVAQLQTTMNAVLAALQTLIAQGKTEMLNTTALTAQVAANTTVEGSALTLIQGFAASQAALSAQLAAAIANNDPVALAAAQKAIDDSVAALGTSDSALAAAIAANTPAAPAAPAAPPAAPPAPTGS
jgi:hypothetical protein